MSRVSTHRGVYGIRISILYVGVFPMCALSAPQLCHVLTVLYVRYVSDIAKDFEAFPRATKKSLPLKSVESATSASGTRVVNVNGGSYGAYLLYEGTVHPGRLPTTK